MSAPRQRSLHFVNISYPAPGDARSARRQARSHSAREVHARTRRAEAAKHRAQGAAQQQTGGSGVNYEDGVVGMVVQDHSRPTSSNTGVAGTELLAVMTSPLSSLASHRKDPFACCAMPLTPVDHFLLDYYVRVVLPSMNTHCVISRNTVNCSYRIPLDWVKLSLTDTGLLCGILLGSCRYLCVVQQQEHKFMSLAMQYKLTSMRQLRVTVMEGASSFDDSTVANALALALDEMAVGDREASRNHVSGAVKMVELNGGPQTLGLNGFLGFLLDKFLHSEGLFDEQPRPADALLKKCEV